MRKSPPQYTGRFWNGVEIKEAEDSLRLITNAEDLKNAKQGDWANCVFANACKRLYGSNRVAFFRHIAYVELMDEKGVPRVERFQIAASTAAQIKTFDKTKIAPPGGFTLRAIKPSYRLDAKSKINRKRTWGLRKKEYERRAKRGKRKSQIRGYRAKGMPIEIEWRTGTGMVHFGTSKPILAANE